MRSGAAVLEPHVVNVRCDWTVAARVGDLTVTDCIAPSRSPYAHVLQGTQGGLCALEVAVFNTASRGDWRRHSWVRPPMATPARRVNHPHRPQRTLSNIPASFVSTMPHASALSHDFDAHPLGHPLSPTASIPPGMDLGAEAAMSPSWATPGENMDATPLSATMTPSRTLWHRRRGTMLDGLETPGTPPPQGQGAPATPQSARRDKGSQEKLGWRAQRAQYWAKAAEREARTVVRVSVSHARTALVFRFLWDILFFGFDLADAAAPARERICAALSLGDAPEQPPPDRPSFPRRKSDDGSESADSSDAGGGAPAQLPMTVEVSVRDLWVDVPRNSLSEQLFVARFDSARLLLPASADKALDDRQILRSSAVGPVLDPSGAETSSQWLSEKRMRAKLNREILGGKARLADPPASTLGESALWDVSDDFLSLISASDLSSALSPRPGVLRIDASGVRIFQAQYEVNTLTGFRPGPLPNVPLAAVATPHGRRMAVPRDLAPYNRIPGAAHAMPGAAAGASALRQSAAEAVLLKGPPRGDRRGSAEKTRGGLSTQPESRQERDSGRYSSGWDSGTSRQAGRGGARVGGTHGLGERSGRPRLGSGFVAQSRWVGVSSPGMHWRHIGAGSDILVTMEMGPTEAFSSWRLRALWPVASMVVGESQYDLLMGVVSENLCEGPSFVNPDIGYPHVEPGTFFGRPIGVPLPPVPPPPDAIGLDEGALSKQWDVGVDVSRIELVMETPNDGLPLTVRSVQGFGESPLLLFKGTDVGVGVHQYDGRGLRVRVGLQGAAASDIRWEDRMPPVPLLRVSPPVRGTTLAARRWREAVATLRGRPAPSVDENHHESAWPDARLSYDLTMQQDGPMAMEIRAFWGSFNWPFLADLSLIWNIVDCTTRYWWQPYVAPRPQRPGPDDWLYVNVLLTSPTFRVPTPASAAPRGPDEPPFESREALVARSEQLRVLYSCGGDREATLRVDIQRLMATLRGASGELSPGAGPLIRPFRGFLEVNWHLPKDIRAPVGLAVKLALTELVIRPAFTHIPHLATLAATLPASIPETPQDDADVPSRPSSPGSPSVPAPNERTLSRARLSTALGRNGMPADEDADGRTLSRDRLSSVIGRSLGSPSGDEGLSTPRARSVRASGWGNRRGSESDDASPLGREPSRVSRRISSSQSVRQLMDTVSQAVDHDRAEKTLLEELVTAAQFRPTVTTVTALLERASVCLVDDRGATPIEVLVASISRANAMVAHETVLPDTPANLVWRVTLSVDVRFLNSAIAQMEPLLEPWVVVAESRSVGGSTSVLLTSSDTVRVVLSPVCMRSVGDALCFHETFMALLASHQEALLSAASQAARPSRQAPRFSLDGRPHLRTLPTLDRLLSSPRAWVPRTAQGNALYVVRNETGCQLSFWADFGGARGAANELMFEIGQGEEASLPMEPIPKIVRMAESQLDIEARTITLQLEGNVHTVENVVIDKAGAFAYLFRAPHGGEDQRVPLIVDVGLEHRTHKIVVRSPYTLRNDTRFPLHFKLHMHRGVVGSRLQALPGGGEMLAPGAECFMPVEHMQSCRLFVGAEGHHRSEKDVVNIEAGREDLRDQQGLITCDPEDTAAPPLVVCLDVSTTILTTLSPDNALIRVPCHTLVFRPVLRLVNLLPAEADFILWDPRTNVGERQRLQPGRTMECYRFDLHHKLLLNVTYGVMQVTAAVAHQPISDILEKDFLSVIEDAKRKTRREVTRMSALELTHTLTGTPMRLGFSLSQRSSVIGHWKELAVLSPHWIVNESGFDLKWRDKPSVVAAVNPAMAAAEPGIARRRRRNEPPLPLGSLRGIVQLSLRFGTPWSHGINLNQVGTKGALCLETSWPLEWEGDVRLREAKHQRPASHHPNASSSGQEHENLLSLRPALSPQADAERDQRGSWTVWNSWDPSMHEVAQESARVHGVRPGMPVWYLSAQRADVKWDRAHGVHHIVRNITRPREGRGQPKARELRPRLEFAVDISMGPGPFSDTRVVSLTPRFTLHNRTHCDIEVAQRGVFLRGLPVVCRIPANASVPFHWPDGATKPELIFRLAEEHGHGLHSDSFLFSGAFRLDTAEDVAFFVPQGPGDDPPPPRPDTPESMPRSPGEEGERRRAPPRRGVIVHAVMKQDRASMSATFFSGRPPPYRIENRCRNTRVFFRQVLKDDTAQEHAVLEPCKIPGKWQTVPYAWDEPLDVRRLEVIIERENFKDASGPTHEYALDDIKVHPAIVLQRRREQGVGGWEQMKEAAIAKLGQRKKERLAGTENVFVAVYADGPTRVLAFSDSQDVLRQLRNEEQEMAMQRRRHEKLTERLEHARTRLQALCRGRVRVYANQIPRADSSDLPVVEEGHERELSHPGNGSSHQGSFTEAQGSGSPSGAARALVKRHSTVARMMSLRKRSQETEAAYTDLGVARWDSSNADGSGDSGADRGEPFVASRRQPPHGGSPHGSALGERGDGMACVRQSRVHGLHGDNADTGALLAADGTEFLGGQLAVTVLRAEGLGHGGQTKAMDCYAILECQGERRSTPSARVSEISGSGYPDVFLPLPERAC